MFHSKIAMCSHLFPKYLNDKQYLLIPTAFPLEECCRKHQNTPSTPRLLLIVN